MFDLRQAETDQATVASVVVARGEAADVARAQATGQVSLVLVAAPSWNWLAVAAGKDSRGVTTTALALAAVWPRARASCSPSATRPVARWLPATGSRRHRA